MKKISVAELTINPIVEISDDWMLITAGTKETGYNTMTASWGHMGSLWGHGKGLATAVVYVRPQRYTREFLDQEKYFTLSFFPKEYRKALGYLGSHSGRNENKIAIAALTPVSDDISTWFAEARLVLICRKIYRSRLTEEGFLDKGILEDNYPERDFHYVYVGEIVNVWIEE